MNPTPPPGEREAPKQDEVPLPEPTFLMAQESRGKGRYSCYRKEQTLRQYGGEGCFQFGYSQDALIAYGNACARAATERAAQVCREHASDMRALHKDDADAEELADAILADVGIKGEKG
jgi:hypothetical protein